MFTVLKLSRKLNKYVEDSIWATEGEALKRAFAYNSRNKTPMRIKDHRSFCNYRSTYILSLDYSKGNRVYTGWTFKANRWV